MWNSAQFLFFKSFLLVLTKLSFWLGDWALGYHSMMFRQFPGISKFPKILSLKSFGSLWDNLVCSIFVNNNRPSFQSWWKEILVKHWKVSKYYETDCRFYRFYMHFFINVLSRNMKMSCLGNNAVPAVREPS